MSYVSSFCLSGLKSTSCVEFIFCPPSDGGLQKETAREKVKLASLWECTWYETMHSVLKINLKLVAINKQLAIFCHYKIRQIGKCRFWLRPRDRAFSYLKKTPWDVLFTKVDSYFPKMLTLTKKSNMFQNWYNKKKLVRCFMAWRFENGNRSYSKMAK